MREKGEPLFLLSTRATKFWIKKLLDEKLKKTISKSLPQFKGAYISYISGLKGIGLDKLRENLMKSLLKLEL